jgi:8-hydroxy-5-deazaflavin:NADPH oxidoreductase
VQWQRHCPDRGRRQARRGRRQGADVLARPARAPAHTVVLLGSETERAGALAGELSGDVRAGLVGDALDGDLVVLAVPYAALDDVLSRYGEQLAGKVVVDITNPVDFSSFSPLPVDGSAAQEIATKVSAAKVAKAFNTTFAGTLVTGQVNGAPLDVFIASDDDEAKRVVGQLVDDGGMRPVDAGPLARAHELEALGYLHMAMQESVGTGFGSAVKLVG